MNFTGNFIFIDFERVYVLEEICYKIFNNWIFTSSDEYPIIERRHLTLLFETFEYLT